MAGFISLRPSECFHDDPIGSVRRRRASPAHPVGRIAVGRGTSILDDPCNKFYAPGVREQFPSTSKFARRGVRDKNGRAPLPEPTAARPGTEAKVRVLAERARLGLALWHPLDSGDAAQVSEALRPPVRRGRARRPLELRPLRVLAGGIDP
jgi:hypothetical protein